MKWIINKQNIVIRNLASLALLLMLLIPLMVVNQDGTIEETMIEEVRFNKNGSKDR